MHEGRHIKMYMSLYISLCTLESPCSWQSLEYIILSSVVADPKPAAAEHIGPVHSLHCSRCSLVNSQMHALT
jgi:hypothetical protein